MEEEKKHAQTNLDKVETQRIALIRKLFNKARERREKVMEFQRMMAQRRRMRKRPLPQVPVFTVEKPVALLQSCSSRNHQQALLKLNLQEHRDININNDISSSSSPSEVSEDNSVSSQSSMDSASFESVANTCNSRGQTQELSSEIYSYMKNNNNPSRQVEIIFQNSQNNINYNRNNLNYCYPQVFNNYSYFNCQPAIHLNSSSSSYQYHNTVPNYQIINQQQHIYY